MKASCCCGATKSNPCECMKKDLSCSSSRPYCPCYKLLNAQMKKMGCMSSGRRGGKCAST